MNNSYTVYFKGGSKIITGVDLKLQYARKAAKIYQGDKLVAYFNTDNLIGIIEGAPEEASSEND